MKKEDCLMIFIALLLLLSSCAIGDSTMRFLKNNDNESADMRMEQVFNAIKEQNKHTLKMLFSEKSIENIQSIDTDIDILFSYVEGNVVSWYRDELPMVFEDTDYGKNTKQIVTWYYLKTDVQNYSIFLVDYPVYTTDPKNVGLYSLGIIKTENESKLIGSWEEWVTPGICIFDI